jgi:hypothetical protein
VAGLPGENVQLSLSNFRGLIRPLLVYEINSRIHCSKFDEVSEAELTDLRALGFDAVWMMGAWEISDGSRKISKVISRDFGGSPFAIPSYDFNPQLGGLESYLALLERAHAAGLSLFLDFISNHLSLDSPSIDQNPEFFIRSDPAIRKQSTADFFLHRSGEVVAFGRDPYFPPWHDTAQLDYACAALRARMIDVLKQISRCADGVRCDMAMLVLRDYIRQMWYPGATERWFNQRMPREFWDEAIREVKATRPDFTFMAEAYWGKEQLLIELGFDLAYDKEMYDALVRRDASLIRAKLNRPAELLKRSLYFIENHDEARAASVFDRSENLAALAFLRCLPGSLLVHEGQMEGRRVKVPVQRITFPEEAVDRTLRTDYERILRATSGDVFRTGELTVFDCGEPAVVSLIRRDTHRVVSYAGQLGLMNRPFGSLVLDVSAIAEAIGATSTLTLVDLLTQRSTTVDCKKQGGFLLNPGPTVDGQSRFCVLEAVPH